MTEEQERKLLRGAVGLVMLHALVASGDNRASAASPIGIALELADRFIAEAGLGFLLEKEVDS